MHETRRVRAMGGFASITAVDAPVGAVDQALAELDRLEALWSRFLPDSDISRLNAAEGEAVRVDPATVGLLRAMAEAVDETGGAFDPTLLPALVEAGYAASRVDPTRVTRLAADARIGGALGDVRIDGTEVIVPTGMTVDAGGIGKGYAADLLVKMLRGADSAGAMVEIGGDLVAWGKAPHPGAWRIGIEDPHAPETRIDAIQLTEGAVATSSTLKRRWRNGAEDHHHLIDPRTGRSALTTVATSTVVAATGARAEALAKLAVLGPVQQVLADLPLRGAAGLVVLVDRSVFRSANWGVLR